MPSVEVPFVETPSIETTEMLCDAFVQTHKSQLLSSGLPELYWSTLFLKLRNEVFDAGNFFQICQRVNEDDEVFGYKAICIGEKGLKQSDPQGVFLIDHAWTYRVNQARACLSENSDLLERVCNLMALRLTDNDRDSKVNAVLENMWKFNQTYKLSTEELTDEEREPIWYVMDEFGSAIRHNDTPTVQCAPFYYLGQSCMFTIMWPLKDLNPEDEVTRDYVYGVADKRLRRCKLTPWEDDIDLEDLEDEEYDRDPTVQPEPGIEYFKSGRIDEEMAIIPADAPVMQLTWPRSDDTRIRVFSDLKSVHEALTDPKYTFVDDMDTADIIFIRQHFKNYKSLHDKSPNTLVNQFPYENVVTVKDLLAIVCRRVADSFSWLPITYNLNYELHQFIEYFKRRDDQDIDNHWILKPWNLARSIDMTITNNLNQIVRSTETGPKIACKYITNPVLFYRDELSGSVKFDVRYIVLLKSVRPLVLYTYNVFWLRFANKPYSLDNLEDYEKHFTVMNYKPTVVLKQIHCDQFITQFEEQNPEFKWKSVQANIFKMIRQVFEGACSQPAPRGIAHNPQSRAMYAIDLMLDWRVGNLDDVRTIEPMICEINFMPDCTRACTYHPNFYNDVFNTLFLDESAACAANVTKI